ncbi:hypothetical protein DMN91_007977 [Ooceraea biroi]|uniref:RRM domain-containing protein n=1 Tax=Ooceraea biroi TaxID=2015173 RepID=A0A3L8DG45_OOCBI|nr:hypothetical protein DMN91_007977 [Ooceraea biroi]
MVAIGLSPAVAQRHGQLAGSSLTDFVIDENAQFGSALSRTRAASAIAAVPRKLLAMHMVQTGMAAPYGGGVFPPPVNGVAGVVGAAGAAGDVKPPPPVPVKEENAGAPQQAPPAGGPQVPPAAGAPHPSAPGAPTAASFSPPPPPNGVDQQAIGTDLKGQPKRLHVSNIPFRFRDPDLRAMFGQFGPILDVEIIFNERGSKITFNMDDNGGRDKIRGNTSRRQPASGRPVCIFSVFASSTFKCTSSSHTTGEQRNSQGTDEKTADGAERKTKRPNRAVSIAIQRVKEEEDPYGRAPLSEEKDMSDNRIRSHECEGFRKTDFDEPVDNERNPGLKSSHLVSSRRRDFVSLAVETCAVVPRRAAWSPGCPKTDSDEFSKAAALRGVAIQRGRVGAARAAFPTGAAALALARNPTPLAAAAAAATALHPFAPTYGREYADPYLGHGIGPVAGYGHVGYCKVKATLNATPGLNSPRDSYLCRQPFTEEATTGSRHTKWTVGSEARESLPSYAPLYSAEDMTRDTQSRRSRHRHFTIIEITIREATRWTLLRLLAHTGFIGHQFSCGATSPRTTEETSEAFHWPLTSRSSVQREVAAKHRLSSCTEPREA